MITETSLDGDCCDVVSVVKMKAPVDEKPPGNGVNCPLIKTSLSMTSLPPDDNQRNGAEIIKAKLRVERPYNSLKKKRSSQRDSWRHSWGSGHSHSSCSLHSNATGIGLSSGKDDFWAALQTNYNYIMDTHLLDSCREARCEIECETRTIVNTPEDSSKMLQPSRTEGSPEDVRNLRRWLREKEDILAKAPTLSEATHMTTQRLQKLLSDHSVLYYDIVSHARVVSACVRASEREHSAASETKERKKTPSPSGEHRTSEDNLKGLERRYHLLYLKAIEVQCLFEGLLSKRSSSSVLSRSSSTDTDDEPASKVARYSELEPTKKIEYGASCSNFNQSEGISDEIISEEEDVEAIWPPRKSIEHLSLPRRHRHYQHDYRHHRQYSADFNTIDFDADSEGSDFEVLKKQINRNSVKNKNTKSCCEIDKLVDIANNDGNIIVLSETTMDSSCQKKISDPPLVTEHKLKIANSNNWSTNSKIAIQSTSGIVITNNPIVTGNTASVTPLVVAKKRQRSVDVSKFNRSNRKSKNCAIFYFKHLDTDNENFGLSSQGSDAIKSGDPSSDDEGWFFSSDCVDGGKQVNDDSDKENKKEIANNSIENQLSNLSSSLISSASLPENVISMDEIISVKDTTDASAVSDDIGNEIQGVSTKTTLIRSKGELNTKTVAVIRVERHFLEGSSVIGQDVKSQETVLSATQEVTNKEAIKQLVLDAENLVRDELLKTPTKKQHSIVKLSSTVKKREAVMTSGSNLQKVKEWLEHQPKDEANVQASQPNTDCEASGEYTESDSSPARDSDNTSEGFTDSVATCMQTGGSNSQGTSTEIIGGSAEPIPNCGSNSSLGKVIRRPNKRNSDRPWSVSCLSQLTETDTINIVKMATNQGLATHSISESALHILSSPGHRNNRKDSPQTPVKGSESKGSLKRRKTRRRKTTSKRSDSGSEGLIQKLFEQQSISSNINIIEDLTEALSMIPLPKVVTKTEGKSTPELENEEGNLPKPNFKVGPITNPFPMAANESKLGSLAALANYMNEEQGEYNTGTEDHSSFSEQAWDNYQEKYNSENYSEGMDSDAVRRLLEFDDDYRAHLDSQSDCCSSLSAANNFDSLSPPQMDSLKAAESKLPQAPPVSTVDHIRRRRALELEYERRRELKKRNSQDELRNNRSPHGSASSINAGSVKSGEKIANRSFADVVRRLDFAANSSISPRKTSESDNSVRRRKSEDTSTVRRRPSRTSDKAFKIYSPGWSSNLSSDDEKEMKHLLHQSRNRLENSNALKIRSHLLRPEDYEEIISTCRDNIVCLNSILRGPPGTVLSTIQSNETRDLLSSWEHLLAWSENAATARKMQEEMIVLKNALNRLGKQTCDLDSETSIHLSVEELKTEKAQLQTYRTNMLRLNASVHSWLTREELKLKREMEANALENATAEEANTSEAKEKNLQINTIAQSANEFHKHLKDEVSDMYSAWDEADTRISSQLESLTASLIAWRQLESGLSEFQQVLDEDRGALEGIEGALDRGHTTSIELAQNVKLVAKLLSEKVDACRQQVAVVSTDYTDQGKAIQTAQFHTIITSSNGSLSDSGISDGGTTSDGGLSERERRLGVLRRLAKQLENALAPGSEALRSIAARMESAEIELKSLQDTCRELIVRTTVSQNTKPTITLKQSTPMIIIKQQQRLKKSPGSKRKNKRRSSSGKSVTIAEIARNSETTVDQEENLFITAPGAGDPDDPHDDPLYSDDDDLGKKRGWAWRVAKIAFPVQLALIALFCASCLMEPHCCDSLNNFSMSFTPQLRYIRGPPPI